MVIAYDSTRHGTNHQNSELSLSAAQPPPLAAAPATTLSCAATRSPLAQTVPGDGTREVALRAILKKKVKGNEESMWGEVRCVCSRVSLNHRTSYVPFPFLMMCPRAHVLVYPSTC
jgi:hypothetical protein